MKTIVSIGTLARSATIVQEIDAHAAGLRAAGYGELADRIANGDCEPREGDSLALREGLHLLHQAAASVDRFAVGDTIADIGRAFDRITAFSPERDDAYLTRRRAWIEIDDAIERMRRPTPLSEVVDAARIYVGDPNADVRVEEYEKHGGRCIDVFVGDRLVHSSLSTTGEDMRKGAAFRMLHPVKRPA
jgi:hypothetical protein